MRRRLLRRSRRRLGFHQQAQRRIAARGRCPGEGQNPRSKAVVGCIEVRNRHLQQLSQLLCERERRRMHATLVTADAGAGRRFVQARQHPKTILRNAGRQPCFAQALAKDRRRRLEGGSHPAIVVGMACTVSTNAVESSIMSIASVVWHKCGRSDVGQEARVSAKVSRDGTPSNGVWRRVA